jgi:hypothetical protein
MNELLLESNRRRAQLSNFRVLREHLLKLSQERTLEMADVAVLIHDLEQNAREQATEGNDSAAESFRQQANRKREELDRQKRNKVLVEEWLRYYALMIKRYERAVRLPLSRIGSDPSHPKDLPELMRSPEWQSLPGGLMIPIHTEMFRR